MRTINYLYNTSVIISYDGIFEERAKGSLDELVLKAVSRIDEYCFTTCDIIDSFTGEILVSIKD